MTISEFKLAIKLVLANIWLRPGRLILTSLSTIAAACTVVWVVSGYDSLVGRFGDLAEEYMGRYEVYLIPEGAGQFRVLGDPRELHLSPQLVAELRSDPGVAFIDTAYETPIKIKPLNADKAGGQKDDTSKSATAAAQPQVRFNGGLRMQREMSKTPTLVGIDSADAPALIVDGKWIDPRATGSSQAVITQMSAESLKIKVGDEIVLSTGPGAPETRVSIVGIAEQPKRLPTPKFVVGLPPSRAAALLGGPANDALYVSTELAEKASGQPAIISYAAIGLKNTVRVEEFLQQWSGQFAKQTPAVQARTADKASNEIDGSTTLESARAQAMSAMGISLLAALFIIFTTLSMGVHERIRQFAVLRAIALTKSQIGTMIFLESLVLGLIGWGGGLLAGWGLLQVAQRLNPEAVAEGVKLGTWSITLSGLCALGGALAAAVLPAWRATRVSPLEAMVPAPATRTTRSLMWMTLIGLALIPINPLVVFYVPMQDAARYGVSAAIGCTTMAIGFILLAPWTVWLTEHFLGPAVARLLGLNPRLLASQLSTNLWRTVGTAVSLTLGLGLFVAMQTWGYSMLQPYVPGRWAPDLIVKIAPVGVVDADIDAIRHVPGVVSDKVVPLAIRHVKFSGDPTGSKVRASSSRQDTCVMVGFDPQIALGGDQPMFEFHFEEGTRQEAIAKLKQGRYCLVPDHFTRESGLGVGDKFAVQPPNHPDQPVEYEIAGVVSMPGWQWMTKMGFRRGRAAGLMFSNYETVQRDFDTGRASMFWMNTDHSATEAQITTALEPIAKRNYDANLAMKVPLDSPLRVTANNSVAGLHEAAPPSVTVRSAESVRTMIRARADGVIWILSQLPLVTLAVTSIGVINTVMSSVRARQWDLGVLRAVGVTRFGLFRLIVAEAILVGLVACLLSLGFGVLAGYCGTGVTRYINTRGGQITPLIIPWLHLSIGFAATLGLCLIAALTPAIKTGRTEPLTLLKAGRAAT